MEGILADSFNSAPCRTLVTRSQWDGIADKIVMYKGTNNTCDPDQRGTREERVKYNKLYKWTTTDKKYVENVTEP